MENEDLTVQEIGEAGARKRALDLIRIRAIEMFGDDKEVMRQVEAIGLAIEAMSSGGALGHELATRSVSWEILG